MAAFCKLSGCLGDGQLLPREPSAHRQNLLEPSLLTESHQTCAVPLLRCFCTVLLPGPLLSLPGIQTNKQEKPPRAPAEELAHGTGANSGFGIHWLPTGKQAPSTLFGELGTWFCRRQRVSACRGRERGWDG